MPDFGGAPPQPGPMPGAQPMSPPPKPEWTPEALDALMADFDLTGMDLAPTADPKSVTDMQRMMRAQYLGSLTENPILGPTLNPADIVRRMAEAANIEDIPKLFKKGPDPAAVIGMKQAQAEVKETEASATLKMQQAEKTRQEANDKAFGRGLTQGQLLGGVGGVEDAAPDGANVPGAGPDGGAGATGMDQPLGALTDPGATETAP